MSDYVENDFRRVADATMVSSRFLNDSRIELIGENPRLVTPRHVLFDFDGTLSLIREGWPDVMIPMMVEFLQATGTDESPEKLQQLVTEFVMELTGKQTIYQMIRLAEEIEKRGGQPEDPLTWKNEYHERLMGRITARREALRTGVADAEEWLVPGSLTLLEGLMKKEVSLYLASGTDENYVREEVELLGLTRFFGRHVYGAVDDYRSFSKARVIEEILEQNSVEGSSLLGFGDGYVEIQNVVDAGGLAVGVATDEAGRSGTADAWKRERLIGAGAGVIVPDFSEAERLLSFVFDGRE